MVSVKSSVGGFPLRALRLCVKLLSQVAASKTYGFPAKHGTSATGRYEDVTALRHSQSFKFEHIASFRRRQLSIKLDKGGVGPAEADLVRLVTKF